MSNNLRTCDLLGQHIDARVHMGTTGLMSHDAPYGSARLYDKFGEAKP